MKRILGAIVLGIATLAASAGERICVGTYNIRLACGSDSAAGNGWGRRCPHVADLVRFHGFEIFGTQEGYKHQLDSLKARLPHFAYTGHGRDDGRDKGEHSAIFYDTDVFELLDSGDFWLSETPDVPGKLGWDAACPRVCSWGKFRHRASGKELMFASVHMDHIGKTARVEGAKLIKRTLHEIAADLPAIVVGDFNVDQTNPAYFTMIEDGAMKDSYEAAEFRYAPNGTFNAYLTEAFSPWRIDHVFVSPQIEVKKYGILTDTYRTHREPGPDFEPGPAPDALIRMDYEARTPSDHFPVLVHIEM